MREGFSLVERTLFESGRGEAALEQRAAFQRAMEERYRTVIERITGRQVIAVMSGAHQDPDMVAAIFVLEPVEAGGDGRPPEDV